MTLRGPPDERSPDQLLTFGVVNLDKPPGPSAHQVVAWMRDLAALDRVAHAGTLDPKVTGCLPTLLGDATRLAQVFDDAIKEYVAVLELHGPAPTDFESILAGFEGEIYQKPPRKSAVKRQLRTRDIYDLTPLEVEERRALLRIRCESGTYVRKLCHDIGLALGTGAHMGHLRRTATAGFDDASLTTMYDFVDALAFYREDGDEEPLRSVVQPAERAIDYPEVTIAPSAAESVATGAPVYEPGVLNIGNGIEPGDAVACYTPDGAVVCLGRLVGADDVAVTLDRVLV